MGVHVVSSRHVQLRAAWLPLSRQGGSIAEVPWATSGLSHHTQLSFWVVGSSHESPESRAGLGTEETLGATQ